MTFSVADVASQLTPRELEVFALIGQALSTVEIAAQLSVSPKTIETHISKIRERFGFRGIRQLIRATRK